MGLGIFQRKKELAGILRHSRDLPPPSLKLLSPSFPFLSPPNVLEHGPHSLLSRYVDCSAQPTTAVMLPREIRHDLLSNPRTHFQEPIFLELFTAVSPQKPFLSDLHNTVSSSALRTSRTVLHQSSFWIISSPPYSPTGKSSDLTSIIFFFMGMGFPVLQNIV